MSNMQRKNPKGPRYDNFGPESYDTSAGSYVGEPYYGNYDNNQAMPVPMTLQQQILDPNMYSQPPMSSYPDKGQNYFNDFSNAVGSSYGPQAQLLTSQLGEFAFKYGKEEAVSKGMRFYSTYISTLKYYYDVDTNYVLRKLLILLFPYSHRNWSVSVQADHPVEPRLDINAPDLYIPSMAFITYLLVAGAVLGFQNRFTPEQIGIHGSSAFGWLMVEIALVLLTIYITNLTCGLTTVDLLAFCSYKYVGMIFMVIATWLFPAAYYFIVGYCGMTITFFMLRTLKLKILEHVTDGSFSTSGNKRRIYLLILISFFQPVMMIYLTYHLIE